MGSCVRFGFGHQSRREVLRGAPWGHLDTAKRNPDPCPAVKRSSGALSLLDSPLEVPGQCHPMVPTPACPLTSLAGAGRSASQVPEAPPTARCAQASSLWGVFRLLPAVSHGQGSSPGNFCSDQRASWGPQGTFFFPPNFSVIKPPAAFMGFTRFVCCHRHRPKTQRFAFPAPKVQIYGPRQVPRNEEEDGYASRHVAPDSGRGLYTRGSWVPHVPQGHADAGPPGETEAQKHRS